MGRGAGRSDARGTLRIVQCRSASETGQVVDVLCDAFHDYPVMRYVIGPAGADYERHLRTLIAFFVQARQTRG
jgi:hypothetical protein